MRLTILVGKVFIKHNRHINRLLQFITSALMTRTSFKFCRVFKGFTLHFQVLII